MSRHNLRNVLFLLGMGFIAALIWHSRKEIDVLLTTVQWPFFILSVLVGSAGYIVSGTFFRELLHKYGVEVDSSLSRKMLVYSQMIKYIPGRVWPLLYQASLLKDIRSSGVVVFANMDFLVVSIILVTCVSASLLLLHYSLFWAFLCFITSMLPFLLCTRYCHLYALIHRLFSRFKHFSVIDYHCRYSAKTFRSLLFYISYSFTYTFSHILMMYSIFGFSNSESSDYIAYLGLGWVVGALSMLVPGGIGVKELVFVILAKSATESTELTMLTTIAVVSRIWTILQEVISVALIFMAETFHSAKKEKSGAADK